MPAATIRNAKYPGWSISREGDGYLMARDAGHYAIRVGLAGGEWGGEVLTAAGRTPLVPFRGTVAECVAEADRRAGIIARTEAYRKPARGAEARRLRGDKSRQPGTALCRPRFARTF